MSEGRPAARSISDNPEVSSPSRVPEQPEGGSVVLRIVGGTAFEVCAELAAFTSGPARASLESGKPWIRETRRLAGPALLEAVAAHPLDTYAGLATLAADVGDDVSIGAFVAALGAMPPTRIRRRLIGADSSMGGGVDDELIEAGAQGDAHARARLHAILGDEPAMRRSVDRLLRNAEDLAREVTAVLESWTERVFSRWGPEVLPILARDVAAKTALLASSSPAAVVAAATNGLAFEPAPAVREVVLAPTVALRPFVVPVDVGATRLFLVSVADESIDPDGVIPNRLVKVAAALGDPIRVRALRELARHDGLTTSSLADRLGVERTSLHHHLGLLRSAGLLAIEDRGDGGWHYRVRRDRVEELGALLRSFLEAPL